METPKYVFYPILTTDLVIDMGNVPSEVGLVPPFMSSDLVNEYPEIFQYVNTEEPTDAPALVMTYDISGTSFTFQNSVSGFKYTDIAVEFIGPRPPQRPSDRK